MVLEAPNPAPPLASRGLGCYSCSLDVHFPFSFVAPQDKSHPESLVA